MHEYTIEPWDHLVDSATSEADLEQYVPPELEKMAYEVISHYDMTVSEMTLITSKPDKGGAIWKIETNHGPRSIKVLHRQPTRSLFSIGAQLYVVQQGARVASLIPTKENHLYVEAGGKLWIVTDWVTPLEQLMKIDLEGASALCYGLGEFHRHTKGYIPPNGSKKSSRLYRWNQYYEKMIQKIGWFRDIAHAYPETVASPHLLSVVDKFEQQANDMYEKFKQSAYRKMIAKGEAHWGLAHQDYGWSNGQQGPGGIWVIDLDGVSYDLPIRDLRKIITSTMDDMGTWDLEWIRGVIDAYHQANPIDQETFELLWIDMAFPNEFYKHVKEVVFEPVNFMNTELDAILDRITLTESNKWEVLSELAKDKEKYLPGDYTEEEVIYDVNPSAVVLGNTDMLVSNKNEFKKSDPSKEQQSMPSTFEEPKESKSKDSKTKEFNSKEPEAKKSLQERESLRSRIQRIKTLPSLKSNSSSNKDHLVDLDLLLKSILEDDLPKLLKKMNEEKEKPSKVLKKTERPTSSKPMQIKRTNAEFESIVAKVQRKKLEYEQKTKKKK
ncbi:CotS family spore coat protein [Robertmurraya korlensis]|uniref:CotS family spore coat protein n=1 Tax=Robertmurraya korlensis TaxID=519977 RepID=UPI00203EB5C3|nr:CotS family spore coat protein [Robertmurraya korlensis]